MKNHHPSCPQSQFWDAEPELNVPCKCPRGWPHKEKRIAEARKDGEQ